MKNIRLTKTFILILFLLCIIFTGCSQKESFHTIYLSEAFSIIPYVSVYETDKDFDKHSFDIKNECNKLLQDLDDKFNVNKEDSMITKVNNEAYNNDVTIDKEFFTVLSKSLEISEKVSEKYDASIYSLSLVWDFKNQYYKGSNYGVIPTEEQINEAKESVDYKAIELKHENDEYTVRFTKEGIKIDLGSIVKGYAADLLEEKLKQLNVNIGIINIGGNIITFGEKEINVGITTPFNEELSSDANIIGIVKVNNDSYTFVTTGIYERYIKLEDGTMYHHILDKETGYPIDNDLYSVTIIINNQEFKSMMADGLSTAVYTLGLEKGLEYCKNNNIEAVFITKDKEIILTDNIKDLFDINESVLEYGYKVKE